MKYESYPALRNTLEINDEVYDQDRLDSMPLHQVWILHEILSKKCGLTNEKWMYYLKGNEKSIFRRQTERGIQSEFQVIKDYYWNRPEHDDLNFIYNNSSSGSGSNALKPRPRLG